MKEQAQPFAQWLATSMQTRALSQAEVARQLGVADGQVSRWRRGQVVPSRRHVRQIAATFRVPTAMIEQLAGYSPTRVGVTAAIEIDPVMEAEEQAILQGLADILEQRVPRALWSAYAKGCEALALELTQAFEHAIEVSQMEPTRAVGFHIETSPDERGNRPVC